MPPSTPRPLTAGPPEGPEAPFPLKLSGKVVKGFGRGSAELGIPTANIPISGLTIGGHPSLASGIYYGFAGLNVDASGTLHPPTNSSTPPTTYAAVLSIGYNPFYKNTVRSVEVHVLHAFAHDFYGAHMDLLVLGFVRPEYDYVSKEALIADIREDVEVARRSLAREAYACWEGDAWLRRGAGVGGDVGS
ncbi:riboflavin kinase [Xylographa opegraphella]|nr:riboflavin kinase [Xylographa opegraphella]